MSLINDALKRATRNQPAATTPAPEPAAPMQPVEYRRRRGLPWYFIPALLAIVAAACWFIVKGVQAGRESSSPVPKPITVNAREPEPQTTAPPSAIAAGVEASPATTTRVTPTSPPSPNNGLTIPEAGPTSTETSAAPSPPAPAPPPEPPKPAYKLQGIFFRTGNPSALVNGKSVWVGSRIDGATVKTITRESLTLDVDGKTTELTFQ